MIAQYVDIGFDVNWLHFPFHYLQILLQSAIVYIERYCMNKYRYETNRLQVNDATC